MYVTHNPPPHTHTQRQLYPAVDLSQPAPGPHGAPHTPGRVALRPLPRLVKLLASTRAVIGRVRIDAAVCNVTTVQQQTVRASVATKLRSLALILVKQDNLTGVADAVRDDVVTEVERATKEVLPS